MDSTNTLPQIEVAQSAKEAVANALFGAASPAMFGAYDPDRSSGLVWGYLGGRYSGSLVANGTSTLAGSNTTYMVSDLVTGAISFATSTTNWNDTTTYGRCYKVVTGASSVTSFEDHRLGLYGILTGAASGSLGGSTLIDGGLPDSTYGGITPISGSAP